MRLVCFGDSNTYGYDPRSFLGGRYGPDVRWTALLDHETTWEVVNAGQNGREVPHSPRQLHQAAEELRSFGRADLTVVMLGGNDLLQNGAFTAADAAARMESFLRFLLAEGWLPSSLLLIAPSPLVRGAWVTEERLLRQSAALGTEYAAVAARLGVRFADSADWNTEVLFDGVHYSEQGHRAFADGMKRLLADIGGLPQSAP